MNLNGPFAFHLLLDSSSFAEWRGSPVLTRNGNRMRSYSHTFALPFPYMQWDFSLPHLPKWRACVTGPAVPPSPWAPNSHLNTLQAADWEDLGSWPRGSFSLQEEAAEVLKSYCPQKQTSTNNRPAVGGQDSSSSSLSWMTFWRRIRQLSGFLIGNEPQWEITFFQLPSLPHLTSLYLGGISRNPCLRLCHQSNQSQDNIL